MFDDIPPMYRDQTADTPEEGWRYVIGDRDARRPPELLTRDHVARCILREVREGGGSPHGGAFLDIAWIKEKIPKADEHIRKKLPSMYHQFKHLAGVDITKEPMEVGPPTHYVMGGVRVDPDTQMSSVPGLFAAGEVAAGLHGANRLGGNSLSDLLVFGKRAGEHAAGWARTNGVGQVDREQVDDAARVVLAPLDRQVDPAGGEGPYQIQFALQDALQDKASIIRTEEGLTEALDTVERLRDRAARVVVNGSREYNPGWHTALDLHSLLTVGEMSIRAAHARKESRGAHTRDDFPSKDAEWGRRNIILKKGRDGAMEIVFETRPDLPTDLAAIIKEQG
jgi:succinate dehydrogenase / fumarate reductase flavoprotein subunit